MGARPSGSVLLVRKTMYGETYPSFLYPGGFPRAEENG